MSEGVKTIIFALIALAVAVAAVVSRPKQEQWKADIVVGTHVFDEFDGVDAANIKIVKYNEKMDKFNEFELARDSESGVWVIPSAAGYPVDAKDRITDATLMLDELEILGVASEVPSDHKHLGVVSPTGEEVKPGSEGVGMLLTFADKNGKELASLVIGHTVKDSEGQRFVRRSDQNAVHVVEIDPDRLSTRFEDWIEKDLLQLTSFDIEDVTIKNYTVDLTKRRQIQRNFDFGAEYKDAKWKLVQLTRYSENQPIAGVLGSGQELDKEDLNDLKTAVDNLEIERVFRKPKGLGHDLKAGEDFLQDRAAVGDLASRGYYVHPVSRELLSASGEVHVGMKDGVEYLLRFGKVLAKPSDDEETKAKPTEATDETDSAEDTEEQEDRYLFVMARVDMSKLPSPELEDLPELPEGAATDDHSAEDAGGGTDDSAGKTAAESTAADEAESTETSKEEPAGADEAAGDESTEGKAKEGEDADAEEEDKEAKEAELLKEHERISKENERKLNEYNEKVKEAKEKVAELNTRFGPWYYVVSDEQCKKIFLGLDELIRKKDDADVEGDGVDAFRDLQDKGLKKAETPAT